MPSSVHEIREWVEAARRRASGRADVGMAVDPAPGVTGAAAAAGAIPAIDQWFEDVDEWAVGRDTARFLVRLVEATRPRSVLEFGAGRSTAAIAHALSANGGGRLTSVDHHPALAAPWLDRARGMTGVDLQTIASPLGVRLTSSGAMFTYVAAAEPIARRGPYDLVFVDAPPSAWGRDCALPLAYEALADPALIVLDDAARAAERASVRRWLRTSRSLEIVLDDASFDRGLIVLAHSGPARRRTSLAAIVGSSWRLLRAWPQRRRVRRAYPLFDAAGVDGIDGAPISRRRT
jgi:predicted O-methyltransferase YrrM